MPFIILVLDFKKIVEKDWKEKLWGNLRELGLFQRERERKKKNSEVILQFLDYETTSKVLWRFSKDTLGITEKFGGNTARREQNAKSLAW